MNPDMIKYPYQQILNGLADIANFERNMDEKLALVGRQFGGVVDRGQWDSDGAQAFHTAQVAWNTGAAEVHDCFTQIRAALTRALESMQSTDTSVGNTFAL